MVHLLNKLDHFRTHKYPKLEQEHCWKVRRMFKIVHRAFQVYLKPSNIVSPDSNIRNSIDHLQLLQGSVVGHENDSTVSMTINSKDNSFHGRIVIGDEVYHIDTVEFNSTSHIVSYQPKDVPQNDFGSCNAGENEVFQGRERIADFVPQPVPRSVNIGKKCMMATVADYSFYQKWGEHTIDVILSVMNDVDAIYKRDIDVSIGVKYIYIAQNNDPVISVNQTVLSNYLASVRTLVENNQLPDFDKNDYCLVNVLSHTSFQGLLGLANVRYH
ncbi:hypothetical protein O9G_003295 [Rozella allomycis CSF55]|uniref:Uncharacterized protein n=1 Tax=Rozella allomycis (strain CSF55) TaxID=988480 RepID=A0A075APR9_ROZAC|nr:hypothetical protein O9G_003295 [Rozella allomycis CSF55]|eukprot:EPZ32156.1 hypothetical protein O9G_003295 [Rozella allomycis CSF55]